MGLMFTGIGLNFLATFSICYSIAEMSHGGGAIGLIPMVIISWLISFIGGLLVLAKQRKIGSILVIIGSVLFVPLGIVAIIGAVRVKEPTEADLELRRQAARQKENN